MTDERPPSRAVEAAARRRRELREALIGFEGALSSPIRDREAWRLEVEGALETLSNAFATHVTETEAADGLYSEMEETAPHLGAKAGRLREEHPQITTALGEGAERLVDPLPDEAAIESVREDLQRLMGRIVRHRQHGADLVWEAYAIDIGNAG